MQIARCPAAVLAMALMAGCNFSQPPPGNAAPEPPAPAAEQAPFRLRTLVVTETNLNITPALAADLIVVQRQAQIVLPPIAGVPQGRAFVIQAVVTAAIRPSSGDTIAGSRGVALEDGESRMFVASANRRWLVLLDGAER